MQPARPGVPARHDQPTRRHAHPGRPGRKRRGHHLRPQRTGRPQGFAGSLGAYAGTVAALVLAGRKAGRELPERHSLLDLAVGGIATQKFARLMARSSIASPLRAPFTTFETAAGAGEHDEAARGSHGTRHTVGSLLTCPYCLGIWVSTGYVAGLVLAPRTARTWAAVFAVAAASDMLQQAYSRLHGD